MNVARLKGRTANNRVNRKGSLWRGQHCTIRFIVGHPFNIEAKEPKPTVYIGSFAGIKLHKHAVKRNRMRRRCREALQAKISAAEKMPTVQLLLSPKLSSLEVDYQSIQTDMDRFYEFLRSQPHV